MVDITVDFVMMLLWIQYGQWGQAYYVVFTPITYWLLTKWSISDLLLILVILKKISYSKVDIIISCLYEWCIKICLLFLFYIMSYNLFVNKLIWLFLRLLRQINFLKEREVCDIISIFPYSKWLKNSKWVWSGNITIKNCRLTQCTARESHTTITRHQEDKLSKATSSLSSQLSWLQNQKAHKETYNKTLNNYRIPKWK